jgi:phosphoribosylformylglycinamidine cyclo-ligase
MERGQDLPKGVEEGDLLFGLASSGVHSNGYSLVRHLVSAAGLSWDERAPWDEKADLGAALLTPTQLYVRPALAAIRAGGVHALAHITGGGITENLPRVLPEGLGAEVDLSAWPLPPAFRWLAAAGEIAEAEMLKTFNCGIGMIVVVAPSHAETVARALAEGGETVIALGRVVKGKGVTYEGSLR